MSKKHRKAWRASVQRDGAANGAATARERPNGPDAQPLPGGRGSDPQPHQLRGLARLEWIDAKAHEMFQRECGADLDLMIRCCQHTAAAFESQMQAAKDDTEPFGPDVTPYENRMTGSLEARLLREKRTWLRDCRQRIEQALDDEAALDAEAAEAVPQAESQGTPAGRDHPKPAPKTQPQSATLAVAANESP